MQLLLTNPTNSSPNFYLWVSFCAVYRRQDQIIKHHKPSAKWYGKNLTQSSVEWRTKVENANKYQQITRIRGRKEDTINLTQNKKKQQKKGEQKSAFFIMGNRSGCANYGIINQNFLVFYNLSNSTYYIKD